ncbi:MAG: tripartite tricarboxylate transporter substrate binding protein, partial [Deinococcota bacterium]
MKKALLGLGLLLVSFAIAQYPDQPITYVVPWSPGGGTDTTSRTVATFLQEELGQPVNVVNRTGGGGVVGHLATASADADGYTIGAVTVEITMMHWTGLTDLTFESYTPLALLVNNNAAVTVRADAPWDTLDELVAYIRENPGELQASGTSLGGIWDLARIGFLDSADLPADAMPWVPSQGAAPAFQELLAGGVDVVTAALAEANTLRQAGEVKVLGVMADERLESFPDVPTLAEQGYDWSIGGWVSLAAPAGVSDEVVDTLAAAIDATMTNPEFLERMGTAGLNIQYVPTSEIAAFMTAQNETMGALLEAA